MSQIVKKQIKDCNISLKINSKQRDKLKILAKDKGVSFSSLCVQMFELSYKNITKINL